MARLRTTVHVMDENGTVQVLGPNTAVPDWAKAAITNPKAWEVAPAEFPAESPSQRPEVGQDELAEPPRHGKGSSAEAWRDYAEKLGWFDKIEADASQRDIVAAVDEERARRAKQNKE